MRPTGEGRSPTVGVADAGAAGVADAGAAAGAARVADAGAAAAAGDAVAAPPEATPQHGWALVTGACSGIGLEVARELGRCGYPLVLVSNQDGSLRAAAAALEAECGVPAQSICMDLARPDAAADLYAEVRRRGLDIEVLVSNAGMLMFGEVATADPERANTLLQLHVVTPSLLATYFGRDMRARRCGHVLIVSSISASRDFPGIALYGSSKRYLRSFAAAVREELRPWGVNVTCVLPGAVATNLYSQTSVPVRTAVKYGVMMSPADVARAAVKGMLAGKATVVPGFSSKAMNAVMRATPRPVIRFVQRRTRFLPGPGD